MSSTDADPDDVQAPEDEGDAGLGPDADLATDSVPVTDESAELASSGEDAEEDSEEEPVIPLSLEVTIDKPGTCQRHITVTVAREDVDRYLTKAYTELAPKAEVPGFRPGRAPRKLVESRFKEQVTDQVKGSLLTDSLEQVSKEYEFSAISEPDFDFGAVSIPDDGPFTFEFDIEVRPEFDMPSWEGLELERPVREYTDEDVSRHQTKLLEREGRWVERDGAAEPADMVDVDVQVRCEDRVISEQSGVSLRVVPTLSFRDCKVNEFDTLMAGAAVGESRETTATITEGAPNEAVRGKAVQIRILVNKIRRMELPVLDTEFLDSIGGFEDEDELHEAIREELHRQLDYTQQQRLREQITAALTQDADWDLPPDLLRRQVKRELERAVLELQRSGFSNDMIRAYENQIRQNSMASTERAIKEHFIFERIAEEQKIDAEPDDYDDEVRLIADQRDESPRRVRARIEKRGQMDALRNQIVERKVIDMICEHAIFTDVPLEERSDDVFPVAVALSGGHDTSEIPEAKHGGEAEELRDRVDHT